MPTPIQVRVEPVVHCDQRLAISVEDVERLTPRMREGCLRGRINTDSTAYIRVEVGQDKWESAIEFTCSLDEAALAADAIREQDRAVGAEPTRCYIKRRRWSRVPANSMLATESGLPNPGVFSVEFEAAEGEGIDDDQRMLNDSVRNGDRAGSQAVEAALSPRMDDTHLNWQPPQMGDDAPQVVDCNPAADEPPTLDLHFGDGQVTPVEANSAWHKPATDLPDSVPEVMLAAAGATKVERATAKPPRTRAKPLPVLPKPVARTYQQHYERWKDCQQCDLGKQRKQVVLCRGKLPCDVLYVGEAPGLSEDSIGIPMVGPAGQRMDDVDARAFEEFPALRRAFVNLVACFPREAKSAGINEPDGVEIEACSERLREIVHLAKPKLVVCVGSLAEKWFPRSCPYYEAERVQVIHPAAVLRMPEVQQGLEYQRMIVRITSAVRRLPVEVKS